RLQPAHRVLARESWPRAATRRRHDTARERRAAGERHPELRAPSSTRDARAHARQPADDRGGKPVDRSVATGADLRCDARTRDAAVRRDAARQPRLAAAESTMVAARSATAH